jgi:hypothetical protein
MGALNTYIFSIDLLDMGIRVYCFTLCLVIIGNVVQISLALKAKKKNRIRGL